jgi:hypothetical protein
MMMMVVVHASHHLGRLHHHVLAFSALPFGCAAGMRRAGMHGAVMLCAMSPQGGAARTGRCAASPQPCTQMSRASTTTVDMSATGSTAAARVASSGTARR